MSDDKVVLTIAPTGGTGKKSQNPNLPTQPDEIAQDVYDCYNAGASVVALHARRPDDGATCNPDIYRDINSRVRAKCDIIINNSTGGGIDGDMVEQLPSGQWETIWEQRLKGMDAGAEMCTLDATTLVVGHGGKEIMVNTSPSRSRFLATEMQRRGIKPEWEVFSPTHLLQDVATLIAEGVDEAPHFINIVLGGHNGFQGAMPYSPRILQSFVDILPPDSIFGVSGIGPAQLPAAMNSLLLGGHVRVGLEDNFYYQHGELTSNVALTERIARLVHEMGRELATPSEARKIMGLPLKESSTKPEFALA